jgi:hypothetical protein
MPEMAETVASWSPQRRLWFNGPARIPQKWVPDLRDEYAEIA